MSDACVALFATVVLIVGGIKLVALTLMTQQVSPALGVRMGDVYLALPVNGVFILVFSLERIVERLAEGRRQSGKEAG